ncbi:formate dehydrogenase subunit gamma [Marinihelvus fidelis]|uniref:NADH-quinone oxidoreductase subunit E n=1 Tax=Marinihelvus fidelis TaxID=2613842 RepID=A0A5N0TBX8_9GAMM|nr:formate dehydrogenase subunit gamma [Marinihelvus fidelis]KAA9132522.1 formate dehydrogenase subunit gamma [Marinihelvus fidelis]
MAGAEEDILVAVDAALATHGARADRLLEILRTVQAELGWIPPAAVPAIARAIDRSRAEVQGVIGFYHDFRQQPGGSETLWVCRAEACQAMGADRLEAHVRQRLDVDWHGTTADGRFTLEPVYCLGNCACTPSIRIGDDVYARVTPERFDAILAQREGGE